MLEGRQGGGMDLQHHQAGGLHYLRAVGEEAAQSTKGQRALLCFLHGYDEAAPTPLREGLLRHGPLRPGNPAGATEPFIVVAPQLPTGGDIWHRYRDALDVIVDEALKECGGDPARCYLTWSSFGANGVFDLALLEPERWAALWAVDPTRVPSRAPGRPVWLSIGAAARHDSARFIRRLHLRPAGEEPTGDLLYLDQGRDHVGSARLAYRDLRIYRWLLAR